MTLIQSTNLLIGIAEIGIVGLILRETVNLGRGRPSVIWALATYFIVDSMVSINRSEILWSRSANLAKATVLDLISLAVLLVIFLHARRLASAAVATVDLAQIRAAEYERALNDYRQVVRHRLMNPLTVVEGAARTLEGSPQLDEETRLSLLHSIIECAVVARSVSLEPERKDSLERELDAIPHLDRPRAGKQTPQIGLERE